VQYTGRRKNDFSGLAEPGVEEVCLARQDALELGPQQPEQRLAAKAVNIITRTPHYGGFTIWTVWVIHLMTC
jgi:hypothetical protein